MKPRPFDDFPDYEYTLEIREWKLPLTEILAGGGPKTGEEEDESESEKKDGGVADMIQTGMDQALGGEPALMTA